MAAPALRTLRDVTVLFAGDSGDGMQLTGTQFLNATAVAKNDLATLPDYPAEIRAPAGTPYGVSGFQLRFGSDTVRTPGDEVDLLVAMNPAALKVNLHRVRPGGALILNTNSFERRDLELAGYQRDPREDGSLNGYEVFPVELTRLTREALADTNLSTKEVDRTKNMFALGLTLWLYSRPTEPSEEWIRAKFASQPEIRDANLHVLQKGLHFGETAELFAARYEVAPAKLDPGLYRAIRGSDAVALGVATAAAKSGLEVIYGSYPITPASDILHELSRLKNFGVMTFQAEDEIAAVGAALGASFGGCLGVTATSGPGMALKNETIGLATMTELPLVIVDVQRGGPSTGLPTKTEQSDLMQAIYGRNGEAPLPVVSASSPGDCFFAAYEAARIALAYMTPVILLADGYIGNGSEPWLIPEVDKLPPIPVAFATAEEHLGSGDGEAAYLPYRRHPETLARPWAKPGTAGLEHRIGGLEKQHETGNVSYSGDNHQLMTTLRAEKVARVAREIPAPSIFGEPEGDLLVIGWGSTGGVIEVAVERAQLRGLRVSSLHLHYMNPLPPQLPEIFARFRRWLVPELNNGQLVRILRERFLLPFEPLNKVTGQPFKASEIEAAIEAMLAAAPAQP